MTISEVDVRHYLLNTPDFFERHLDLLSALTIPHPSRGVAISLLERQVLLLRQVAGQHKAEFDHLVSVARENEAIMQKTRRLIVAGLECQTLEDFRITLDDMVRQNFTSAQHALHLFDGNPSIKAQLKKVLPEQGCYYGRLSSIELECLFGNTSGSIRSAAVLPLRSNSQGRVSCYGVVALGSDSSDMFSTRKGGLFLEYLTELLSAIVLRLVL